MSCPQCGSDSRVMIGPALFRCTNMLYDRVPVPPPIGRPFALTYQDVGFECGQEYPEGSTQPGDTGCPEHGLFPAGVCGGCRGVAVCARCGRGKCRTCRGQDEAAEAKARREQQAREQAARQARKDAHAADARASTARQAKSQQQYIAELRKLDREIRAVNTRLRKSLAKFSVGYAFSALVGLGFWIVALIIIVKTPVKVVSVFPFGIGLAFMSPVIMWANGARRKSKAASLNARRDALLSALGCGQDCWDTAKSAVSAAGGRRPGCGVRRGREGSGRRPDAVSRPRASALPAGRSSASCLPRARSTGSAPPGASSGYRTGHRRPRARPGPLAAGVRRHRCASHTAGRRRGKGPAHPAAAKVIATLTSEWDGLVRHQELPQLPLNNNPAERALRTPVIGRKNFYGSGAEWAAHLAADVWTVTAAASRHGIEPLGLLTGYLQECARNGGIARPEPT